MSDQQMIASGVIPTGANSAGAAQKTLHLACERAGCPRKKIQRIVGTGYGRVSLDFVDKTITELTCHAKGCHFINTAVRTVLDIGGQDSKVIRVDDAGNMTDFIMNDKCAAGTGRFLEVVAQALEIDLDALGDLSLEAGRPCKINSTCSVFAESEVVSLLAKGEHRANIVAGINRSFATRIGNMVKRLGISGEMVFVGGVAKNHGLVDALSDFMQTHFLKLDVDPQIMGALGAAVMARQLA
ncbi:HgdC2: activator of 2-hydroxyglutaryl-CoA dehydratase, subunit alpha [Desulfosarcina variabilis str. Montpellier]